VRCLGLVQPGAGRAKIRSAWEEPQWQQRISVGGRRGYGPAGGPARAGLVLATLILVAVANLPLAVLVLWFGTVGDRYRRKQMLLAGVGLDIAARVDVRERDDG